MTTAPDDPTGPRADGSDIPYPAIFWLSTASFAAAANFRVVDTMLPAIGEGFGVSAAQASIVVASYAVTFGVLQLLYGQLGDRYGRLWVATVAAGFAGFLIGAANFGHGLGINLTDHPAGEDILNTEITLEHQCLAFGALSPAAPVSVARNAALGLNAAFFCA